MIHGHNIPSRLGRYDHYSSELVLLYVVTLASEELAAFRRMTRRVPTSACGTGTRRVRGRRTAIEYFWFLTGRPQAFDRIQEVHTRFDLKDRQRAQRFDPAGIPESRIRYYANPLTRLIELHADFGELVTGLTFRSPFPRTDARFRR